MQRKIKEGIYFVIGGIALKVIDKVWDWSESLIASASLSGWSLSDILTVVVVAVGGILIGWGVYESRQKKTVLASKPPATEDLHLDPRFEHAYAVLFYPEEISWEKHERQPEKNMPRWKAVVNPETKKSFWMLDYAIDLLMRYKIQYVTQTWKGEQEFKDWFISRGISPPEKHATESDLLARSGDVVEEKKRAFKLALRKEIQGLVDNINNSRDYRLFHYQEWSSHIPSERRLLLNTDREWELLTDFYGKLQARNDYASEYQPYDPALTKSKTMAEFDEQCVKAGLRALKDIEWGR